MSSEVMLSRAQSQVKKEKKEIAVVFLSSIKRAIREFHVGVEHYWQKSTKKCCKCIVVVLLIKKCCFHDVLVMKPRDDVVANRHEE